MLVRADSCCEVIGSRSRRESPFLPSVSWSWGPGRAGWAGLAAQQALTWQPSTSERRRWKRKRKGEGTFAAAWKGGLGADMCRQLQPSWRWREAHGETHGGKETHSCVSCDARISVLLLFYYWLYQTFTVNKHAKILMEIMQK